MGWIPARGAKGPRVPSRFSRNAKKRSGAERAAETHVAGARAKAARRRRASANPFDLYLARISGKSKSHQKNHARFKLRLEEWRGGEVKLSELDQSDVESWRDWLLGARRKDDKPADRPLAPKTVKEHIDWLAAVCNCAGIDNPCRGVERPARSHADTVDALEYFTPGEMEKLFAVCRERFHAFANAFQFLAYTGCRVGEARGLRPRDLDFKNQIANVTGKGRKRRPLRLSGPLQPAWEALQSEIALGDGDPERFIFPQGETWFRKGMDRLCPAAIGRHGHPHMLRHTLASLALLHFDPPWTIEFLAKFLGHSSISTTFKVYGHWIAAEPPSSFCYKPATKRKGGR